MIKVEEGVIYLDNLIYEGLSRCTSIPTEEIRNTTVKKIRELLKTYISSELFISYTYNVFSKICSEISDNINDIRMLYQINFGKVALSIDFEIYVYLRANLLDKICPNITVECNSYPIEKILLDATTVKSFFPSSYVGDRLTRSIFDLFKVGNYNIMTDEEFQKLLDDELEYIIDFGSITDYSITDLFTVLMMFEYRIKKKFAHILARNGILDFNMCDYNITIAEKSAFILLLYDFAKTFNKVNKANDYSYEISKHLDLGNNKPFITTLVKVKSLLEPLHIENGRYKRYHRNRAMLEGNVLTLDGTRLLDYHFYSCITRDYNPNGKYIDFDLLYYYTSGICNYAKHNRIELQSIYPLIDDMKELSDLDKVKMKSTLFTIMDTGTINEDGSYTEPKYGLNFILRFSKEERELFRNMQEELAQGRIKESHINRIVSASAYDFFVNIFEPFLDSTVVLNLHKFRNFKYFLAPSDRSNSEVFERFIKEVIETKE